MEWVIDLKRSIISKVFFIIVIANETIRFRRTQKNVSRRDNTSMLDLCVTVKSESYITYLENVDRRGCGVRSLLPRLSLVSHRRPSPLPPPQQIPPRSRERAGFALQTPRGQRGPRPLRLRDALYGTCPWFRGVPAKINLVTTTTTTTDLLLLLL